MEKIKIGKTNNPKRKRTNVVDKDERAYRRKQCMNALLNRPWITKESDPELYYWIKDQISELKTWFNEFAGYSLILNRKLVKLEKTPVIAHPWMGFQEFREPLDYTLFTYGLWFLEQKTESDQFLLTELIREIRDYMVEQGMEVDWKNYFHRLSMSRAIKKLKSLDIVRGVDGNEMEWATHDASRDVLYECTSYHRYVLRNLPRELMSYFQVEELRETQLYGDDLQELNRRRRHEMYRRFLLEPVVLDKEWKDDLYYFYSEKNKLLRQLQSMFGWEGSEYREGLLFFEEGPSAEAEVFPTLSAISDIGLLLCGQIRTEVQGTNAKLIFEQGGQIRLTKGHVERILLHLKDEYKEFWANEYRKKNAPLLAEDVCQHLIDWGLAEWDHDGFFVVNAAVGRWTAKYGSVELDT
ncbi:TIGR02678 family protein [Paenibacillus uliginis N3/975]|uniref:TIGR02678 family protein n=1 Tax=Paenibacillus uliginis N3/975 TaxID=1313296 RepID=A0A1X7HNX0_9BACL|nr:TIGR02678 family protein [Paenibacillus uliginis]SMF90189.1 TIGR02678 family protein [Paenibacillus uliginis N3/975]